MPLHRTAQSATLLCHHNLKRSPSDGHRVPFVNGLRAASRVLVQCKCTDYCVHVPLDLPILLPKPPKRSPSQPNPKFPKSSLPLTKREHGPTPKNEASSPTKAFSLRVLPSHLPSQQPSSLPPHHSSPVHRRLAVGPLCFCGGSPRVSVVPRMLFCHCCSVSIPFDWSVLLAFCLFPASLFFPFHCQLWPTCLLSVLLWLSRIGVSAFITFLSALLSPSLEPSGLGSWQLTVLSTLNQNILNSCCHF